MTKDQVIKAVRALGLVCKWDRDWQEWVINYAPGDARRHEGPTGSSYHTQDREDAVETAGMMAKVGTGKWERQGLRVVFVENDVLEGRS